MKYLSTLVLILILSCSHAPREDKLVADGSLESLLSPEDLRIHQCLHSGGELSISRKKECLMGTAYELHVSRMPSEQTDEMVMKNNWFFGDNSKLNDFYNISRSILKTNAKIAKAAINDRGVAVEGQAYFGFGGGWLAELVNHDGELGLFCAPFVTARTDIGIDASISLVQSISCPSNKAYEGGFLGISTGLSGELIGLPVDVSVTYNFGLNLPAFAESLKQAKAQKRLVVSQLALEVARLSHTEIQRGIANNNTYNAAVINLLLRPLSILGVRPPTAASLQQMNQILRNATRTHRSLGKQFKSYFQSHLSPYLRTHNLPQLNQFFTILTSSLTGCDSTGGAMALGLSLSPVSVGVNYENYHLLFEMPFSDLRAFKALSPMLLLNPFLLAPEDLRATVRLARGVLAIPVKVDRQCNVLFPRI